jgi:hypothetical protein
MLDNLFTDPAWCKFSPKLNREKGAYPNTLYHKSGENVGAVVSVRGQHDSFSLNQSGVKYLLDAVHGAIG